MINKNMNTEEDERIITKYPNRRIYDTRTSKYIKVEDLRRMVIEDCKFRVIDSKTKEDVTRSLLLQIIIEQESESNPLFTSENLKNFIRYRGVKHQQIFTQYLNQSLAFFQQQHELLNSGVQAMLKKTPMKAIAEITRMNTDMWQKLQTSYFDKPGKN
jgi:polyhydroxyalkanoate synthesis repressor PhaR